MSDDPQQPADEQNRGLTPPARPEIEAPPQPLLRTLAPLLRGLEKQLRNWIDGRRRFPLPMLGMVHVRNSIRQTRPLRADETYSVTARITESRRVRAGLEFDIVTEFSLDEAVLYTSVMTTIFRISEGKGGRGGARPRAEAQADQQLTEYRSFDVPADMGRRYAAAGKDYNPIHLTALSAKLFGFKRAIAHGMWSLAHCAAHPAFEWTADNAADWLTPFAGWPGTRYEAKAKREGRRSAYLTFRRT